MSGNAKTLHNRRSLGTTKCTKVNDSFWDEQGLIHSLRHEENGYRMFNIDDIFQIYDINFYRKLDVPIKQMKNLYGKTIEEHYATIAETEQRIKQEKISLQKT